MANINQLNSDLLAAKAKVAQLEDAIENYDNWPVGTILREADWVDNTFPFLIKLASVYVGHPNFVRSTTPVWMYLHSDGSSRGYGTLEAAQDDLWTRDDVVAYEPQHPGTWPPFDRN